MKHGLIAWAIVGVGSGLLSCAVSAHAEADRNDEISSCFECAAYKASLASTAAGPAIGPAIGQAPGQTPGATAKFLKSAMLARRPDRDVQTPARQRKGFHLFSSMRACHSQRPAPCAAPLVREEGAWQRLTEGDSAPRSALAKRSLRHKRPVKQAWIYAASSESSDTAAEPSRAKLKLNFTPQPAAPNEAYWTIGAFGSIPDRQGVRTTSHRPPQKIYAAGIKWVKPLN